MRTLEYNIEIITPCFCAGADQKKAEIRVPSIRGQVRWWFRALGGAFAEESELFGCAGKDSKASKLVFRILPPAPSSNTSKRVENDYLLWPLRSNERGFIDPPAHFTLIVKEIPQIDDKLFTKITSVIEMWILLGAIGTRSRRCAGSLWLKDRIISSPEELARRIKELSGQLASTRMPEIYIFAGEENVHKDVQSALKGAGRWLQKWRAGSNRTGLTPSKWGQNDHDAGLGKFKVVYRPVLGLPLLQRYTNERGIKETFVEENGKETDRWASPLHMKIAKFDKSFVPMIVFFPDFLIKEGTELKIKDKNSSNVHKVQLKHDLIREMLKDNNLRRIYP